MVDSQTIQSVCSEIARLLRTERERQGLAMLTVAERAGLSQQMVSYVEREIRRPTLDTALRIAAALELDLADIIKQAATSRANSGGIQKPKQKPKKT